ncbi:MAG: hypothetical protein ABIQ73_16650 [Acidimicrobiales bacterium]
MSSSDPSLRVVGLLTDAVIAGFSASGNGVHVDTALAGTAATAGAFLLRQVAGSVLDDLSPGSPVLVDIVNDAGPRVLGLAQNAASSAGVEWDSTGADIPADNQPHAPHVALVRQLEAPLSQVLTAHSIDRSAWADHTLLAAVDLVVRAGTVISASVATRIVTWSFVVGCKTVPYPVEQ